MQSEIDVANGKITETKNVKNNHQRVQAKVKAKKPKKRKV